MRAQLLEGVAAAQEALGLLVGAGDLTGALDVLADLRAAATPAADAGLAALRPLPQQLAAAGAVRSVWPSGHACSTQSTPSVHVTFHRKIKIQKARHATTFPQTSAEARPRAGCHVFALADLIQWREGIRTTQAIDELLAAEFLHATRCRGLGAAVERALDDLQQLARCVAPTWEFRGHSQGAGQSACYKCMRSLSYVTCDGRIRNN